MKKISLSLLVFLFSCTAAQAQVMKKLKEKATNAIGLNTGSSDTPEDTKPKEMNIEEVKAKVESHQIEYGNMYSNVVTSPAHQKYMKKVVFSNSEIKFKNEDTTKFKKTFNINEPINMQFYLERTVSDQTSSYSDLGLGNYPQVTGIIYVDNQIVGNWILQEFQPPQTGYMSWTTNGYGLSTTNIDRQKRAAEAWTNALSDIAVGSHTVKIEIAVVTFYTTNDELRKSYDLNTEIPAGVTVIKDVMSSGEMTLNVTAQGKTEFVQKFGIKPPGAAQKNPTLEKEMKTLVEAAYHQPVMKVIILDAQWGYERNDYGVLVSRYVYGLTISKNSAGICEGSVFLFSQDKGEGNNYGSTYIDAVASASEWAKSYTCGAIK